MATALKLHEPPEAPPESPGQSRRPTLPIQPRCSWCGRSSGSLDHVRGREHACPDCVDSMASAGGWTPATGHGTRHCSFPGCGLTENHPTRVFTVLHGRTGVYSLCADQLQTAWLRTSNVKRNLTIAGILALIALISYAVVLAS